MKNDVKSTKQLKAEAIQDLREHINEFFDEFSAKVSNANNFLTMDDLETLVSKLDSETRKTYLNMISDSLNNLDEKELIKSKKASSPKRG